VQPCSGNSSATELGMLGYSLWAFREAGFGVGQLNDGIADEELGLTSLYPIFNFACQQ